MVDVGRLAEFALIRAGFHRSSKAHGARTGRPGYVVFARRGRIYAWQEYGPDGDRSTLERYAAAFEAAGLRAAIGSDLGPLTIAVEVPEPWPADSKSPIAPPAPGGGDAGEGG